MSLWPVYTGTSEPHDGIELLPPPPPWRAFDGGPALPIPPDGGDSAAASPDRRHRARTYLATDEAVQLVNAALYLRRPLLVTGPPGSGKSSLPYSVARELGLGPVLRWNITSRTTLREGLYHYDPLSRLYAAGRGSSREEPSDTEVQDHLRLGPLGTALLPYERPRALLIDEFDKSDLDLPNDLLNVLEEGQYEIPELVRVAQRAPTARVMVDGTSDHVRVNEGRVRCQAFPFVVLTSNGEQEFPPAFLRRCVHLTLRRPSKDHLESIVRAHLGELDEYAAELIDRFLERQVMGELATDQLLNAIYLAGTAGPELDAVSRDELAERLLPYLNAAQDGRVRDESDVF
ncbi:MoxR family ATPase [Streptomyces canus]|uniref:AAA family ATPase n=1 Tax=Streptomyces canus TaxID=58343 RepID=UPI0003670518|nr:MoxR family ATPase [Streptomyces canus]